jgi:predicted PurR-regulated permease PerM
MTMGEQLRWWGIGFAVFIVLLWLLKAVVLPFVLGAGLAYLTDPIADRLQRQGMSRLLATVVIAVGALAVVLLALLLVIPTLIEQIRHAIAAVPAEVEWLRKTAESRLPALADAESALRAALDGLRARAADWSTSVLKSLWSGGVAAIDFISVVAITPVVAFYLLYDWDRMVAAIDDCLPRQHRDTIRQVMRDVDRVLAGFVRGQLSVCAILGAFYAIALSLIGLQFGLLIGAFAGLISFIPFVGTILGGVASVGVAALQFWGQPQWIAAVLAVFVLGQQIEGNFLTPKLVGGQVGLHPVWLIFALSAFGSLFGFVGLLIAVPSAAAIGVIGRFLIEQYKQGGLYRGSAEWQARTAENGAAGQEERE